MSTYLHIFLNYEFKYEYVPESYKLFLEKLPPCFNKGNSNNSNFVEPLKCHEKCDNQYHTKCHNQMIIIWIL